MNLFEALTSLGDAIREKTGGREPLSLLEMRDAVAGLENCCAAVAQGDVTELSEAQLSGITALRNYAFYGCDSLTSLVLPETLTQIGTYAFYGCTALSQISLPKSLTSIGARAFMNCKSIEKVVVPEGVTTIPAFCFSSCSALRTLILVGDTVKEAATANILGSTPINAESIPIYIATVTEDASALAAAYAEAENWGDYFYFAPVSEYGGEWQ